MPVAFECLGTHFFLSQSAYIKEQSDSSQGFQLQVQRLYEQFPAVDKGVINLTLSENG